MSAVAGTANHEVVRGAFSESAEKATTRVDAIAAPTTRMSNP
jgi:hypothetical protein